MVKADIKRNYYADLELPNDASVDDIKKAYRKLALKYHPDRNPGKESEIVPKFQAIQAAHEILQDPTSKTRYDADRRKAGLGAFGKPTVPPRSAAGTNPMYQTTSAYPPPPRRTPNPTASWRSTTAGGGADRFANFPKPAPTSKKSAADSANVFNAWQNMKPQNAAPPPPQPPPRATPKRPVPNPPPRRDTQFPTEDEIRAGMNYRAPPSKPANFRSAWSEYNADSTTASSSKTPKRGGFDPSSGTGDEGQAASTSNYSSSRRKSADPPYFPPPPRRSSSSQQADTAEASHSTGEHTANTEGDPQFRHSTRKAGTGTARKPFVVYSSSDDSDTEDDDTRQPNAQARAQDPTSRPFTRPKKTPNPPSRRFKNGAPFKAPVQVDAEADEDKATMYATSFSTPSPNNMPSPVYPFGRTYQHSKSPESIPAWAVPSTVPPVKRSHSAAQRAWGPRQKSPAPEATSHKNPPHAPDPADLIDLTIDDSHTPKKTCFTKHDATGLFTMPINADTFRPNVAKSRSEDHINTSFDTSQWAGDFGSNNNVFAAANATGRTSSTPSRKGSKALRQQPRSNTFQESNTELPIGTAPPSPPAPPVKYSADEWAKHFKDSSWAFDPDTLRSTSPGKSESRSMSRANSASVKQTSKMGNKIPTTTPRPATVTDEHEEAATAPAPAAPTATAARTQSPDEMDVDDTPPAASSSAQEARIYLVDPSASSSAQEARSYPVNPPSADKTTDFNPKLDDLSAAVDAPPSSQKGLDSLSHMTCTLPFPSKAASTIPTRTFTPQTLQLPTLPRSPPTPTKLTRSSWSAYCTSFSIYLDKFDKFNSTLLDHFGTRRLAAAKLVKSGVRALEAVGEASTAQGFMSYARGVKEDERVREHWNLGCERHAEAVGTFESVRERVRVLSEGGGMVE